MNIEDLKKANELTRLIETTKEGLQELINLKKIMN
jgi:hypothetical protein